MIPEQAFIRDRRLFLAVRGVTCNVTTLFSGPYVRYNFPPGSVG